MAPRSLRAARIAVVVLAIGCGMPTPARAACQIESLELPVKMSGTRAVAMVGINGTQVPLTVDSGAFFSVLTDAAAAQLQLVLKRNPGIRCRASPVASTRRSPPSTGSSCSRATSSACSSSSASTSRAAARWA